MRLSKLADLGRSMQKWQLKKAKGRLYEVVNLALTKGPQLVTIQGARAVVILSEKEYLGLVYGAPTLIDHILNAPRGEALVIDRSNKLNRAIDL